MLFCCMPVPFGLLTLIESRRVQTSLASMWMEPKREAFLKVPQLERADTQPIGHIELKNPLSGVLPLLMRHGNPKCAPSQEVLSHAR